MESNGKRFVVDRESIKQRQLPAGQIGQDRAGQNRGDYRNLYCDSLVK